MPSLADHMEQGVGALRVDEIHDALIALEEEEGFFERSAGGQRFWHQLRHNLYGDLLRRLRLHGRRPTGHLSRPLSSFLRALKRELSAGPEGMTPHRWGDLRPADLLVFNHERHVRDGDRWICPYSQPLLDVEPGERSRWSRVVVQDAHEGVHLRPAPAEGLHYLSWQLARQWARTGLRRLARPGGGGLLLCRHERREVRGMAEAIGRRFGIDYPARALIATTQAAVFELNARTELYQRLLDAVRPRAVVVVVGYGYRALPLVRVARARGVPTIELQHGLIGPTHLAYNFGPGRRPLGLSDYLMTFGDFWRRITPGLPLDAAHAPPIGFGWLDRHRATPEAPHRLGAGEGPMTILVISQGTIARELSALITELAERLPRDRYRIRYKLHPGEIAGWRERYPELARAPVEVVDRPTPIYEELARADAQIGVYSTALFEGLAFGLPTFVVKIPGWEASAPLVDAGAATLVEDAASLAQALGAPRPPSAELSASIWRPHARRNFRRALSAILDGDGPPRAAQAPPRASAKPTDSSP